MVHDEFRHGQGDGNVADAIGAGLCGVVSERHVGESVFVVDVGTTCEYLLHEQVDVLLDLWNLENKENKAIGGGRGAPFSGFRLKPYVQYLVCIANSFWYKTYFEG